jgi:hypothetical protein
MQEWLRNLSLPKGSDLALWLIGVIALASVLKPIDPQSKDVVLALGAGLTGFLSGYHVGKEPPNVL